MRMHTSLQYCARSIQLNVDLPDVNLIGIHRTCVHTTNPNPHRYASSHLSGGRLPHSAFFGAFFLRHVGADPVASSVFMHVCPDGLRPGSCQQQPRSSHAFFVEFLHGFSFGLQSSWRTVTAHVGGAGGGVGGMPVRLLASVTSRHKPSQAMPWSSNIRCCAVPGFQLTESTSNLSENASLEIMVWWRMLVDLRPP